MDSNYLDFPFFTQGNSIYAEIPASEVERHSSTLEEGKIYIMSRFRVCNAKNYCKSLPGPYMLEITCHTRINLARETATFHSLYSNDTSGDLLLLLPQME